jgi:hypothetical protein
MRIKESTVTFLDNFVFIGIDFIVKIQYSVARTGSIVENKIPLLKTNTISKIVKQLYIYIF